MNQERKIRKLEERLAKKDRQVRALERQIYELQKHYVPNLNKAIEKGIEVTLSNMRFIPVMGIGRDNRIIEIQHNVLTKSETYKHLEQKDRVDGNTK